MSAALTDRRRFLGQAWHSGAGAAALLGASTWLTGCATVAADAITPQLVAPGVYLLPGATGEIGPDNRGRIGNVGVIVGTQGVLVIDSGVSWRHGQALRATIARITPLPIRHVVLTHVRQEFVFGASAFQEAGVPITMHVAAARLMASRCESCLKTLVRVLGADEMTGSRVIKPEDPYDPTVPTFAPFGIGLGRPVRLLAWGPGGHSSGPGDLAVLDDTTGTLFAGGLLDADTVPDIQDADFAGWRSALAAMEQMGLQHIVPGHGPVSPPGLTRQIARYLTELETRTLALLEAGTALSDVPEATRLPDFEHWDQYDTIHRRNAAIMFLRHERAMMLRQR